MELALMIKHEAVEAACRFASVGVDVIF